MLPVDAPMNTFTPHASDAIDRLHDFEVVVRGAEVKRVVRERHTRGARVFVAQRRVR